VKGYYAAIHELEATGGCDLKGLYSLEEYYAKKSPCLL